MISGGRLWTVLNQIPSINGLNKPFCLTSVATVYFIPRGIYACMYRLDSIAQINPNIQMFLSEVLIIRRVCFSPFCLLILLIPSNLFSFSRTYSFVVDILRFSKISFYEYLSVSVFLQFPFYFPKLFWTV